MNLATIGTSAITQLMLDHTKELSDLHRYACYSRNEQKAGDFRPQFGFEKSYSDLDQMLEDPIVDVVYIASPNTLHYPQAKKALEHGKNVILEKPFASTLEQAQDLFDTAEANGLKIFEAITNVHTPNFGLLLDNLPRAGKIRQAILNFSQYSSRYDKYRKHELSNAFDPAYDGGALTDINVYNLHLARGLFGKPESVQYYPVFGWNNIDTSGTLVMQYPEFVVTAVASKDCFAPSHSVIQGEDGTFIIDKASTGKMEHVRFLPVHPEEGLEDQEISIDQGPHMTFEFMGFLTALQENDEEMYRKAKEQTLDVMDMLQQAKTQRDAAAAK